MTRGHGDVQAIGHRNRHITHTVFFPDFLLEKLTKKKLEKSGRKREKTDDQDQQREQHRMRHKRQQMAVTASEGKSVKEEAP
jgi:hypothetical protein